MKLFVFSVLDMAVKAYMQPFYCRSHGEAVRSFTDAVNDPKGQFGRHSTDYILMHHGLFDDQNGLFESIEPVRVIGANEVLQEVV